MKIKELKAVLEQFASLSEGERANALGRLAQVIAKLPQNDTVSKALKKR